MVSVTGILVSSLFIDVLTLLVGGSYRYIKKAHSRVMYALKSNQIFSSIRAHIEYKRNRRRGIRPINPENPRRKNRNLKKAPKNAPKNYGVTVIIPAYNEEEHIGTCIHSAFNQTVKPKKVIVIDDCSTDRTPQICTEAKKKYRDLVVIERKNNRGKAFNISQVVRNYPLNEITIVLDADTYMTRNYIEEITKPFSDDRVVISTGYSLPITSHNVFGRIIFHGTLFQYLFFGFRKEAQAMRNAVSVIAGDSAAYRSSFLKKIGGFPLGTVTEDMDLTWQALEMGHTISFQKNAFANSNDPSTLKGHWKQICRWYSGGFQCIYKHGRKLLKAKKLLLTTLIPVYVDTFIYAPLLLLAPVLIFFYPFILTGFYIVDLALTCIAVAYFNWKGLKYLPEVYIIKHIWALAWMVSALKTTLQYISGRRSWASRWSREGIYARTL